MTTAPRFTVAWLGGGGISRVVCGDCGWSEVYGSEYAEVWLDQIAAQHDCDGRSEEVR